jgi:glycerol-3-phosphate dehydrogenase
MSGSTRDQALDLLVVGGGVTGAGVARDAALRGLRVCLVEQRDFASGTTWGSSGMIHGGIRYLEHDWETTRISCLDSGYIKRIAPHLLFPVVFLVPVYADARLGIETMEVGLEAYDRFQPYKAGRPHVRLSVDEALTLEPGLNPRGLVGALTMDEWGVDAARLVVLNALDARANGAELRTWTEVVGLLRDGGGAVSGARIRSRITGVEEEIRAAVVCNAAGPWAAEVCAMAAVELRLRPAKGIHLVYERRITNVALSIEAIDGRGLLLVPHAGTTLLGTTDDDHYGDPERLDVTEDEVEYVLQATERVLPSIRHHRIAHATAAVRPTLHHWRRYEDDLSREYAVVDHALEGVPGLVTVAGGKMSMFRKMAEDTVDSVLRALGRGQVPCTTNRRPLPGGGSPVDVEDVANSMAIPLHLAQRLAARHGDGVWALLREAEAGERSAVVCECEGVTRAELRHSIRHEQVERLEDLYRRVRITGGACQGMRCCWAAAQVMGGERGWSPARIGDEVREFLEARWRDRPVVLRGVSAAQEELYRGAMTP